MGLGDVTDADTTAMEVFSQRVLALVEEVPGGALRRVVDPPCAGGIDECKYFTGVDAEVTKNLQQFITDVRYGFSAYAQFVRNEGVKYLQAAEAGKRAILDNDLAKRRDANLPAIAPEFPPAVAQPK
ncbi:hypothetical protein [Amycolatopsis sp. NPDC051071]|uniref:hypothetical protein n=1 Tax=Amycolatopsis sp. NPDC051071 TaxID=3154637 RepID=UPI00341BBE37